MTLTNIPRFLNSIVAELQSDAWMRGIRLVADTSTPVTAEVAADDLKRMLADLVSSVLSVVPRGGSVSLVSGCEAGDLKLQLGAPGLDQSRISGPMKRLADHVKASAGTVVVRDSSDFWTAEVTLPGATMDAAAPKQRTVVVVDDDVDTQEFLTAVLEEHGFRVVPVNDGFDALVAIERHNPDIVLTDVLMPNMNGIDLVARIRKARTDLPVIVFSGYRDVLINNVAGLPDRILPKPMSKDQVLSAVAEVLAEPRH